MMNSQPRFEPCDKYERLLEQKVKKFFCGQLRDSCFEKVLNLDASYAYSDEPIPFSEVSRLTFQPIRKGEIWAKKNFACAWFRLSGSIPAEMDRRNLYLEFSDDGEALLVDSNGSALKGFTAGSVVFGILDSSIEKRYYQLEDVLTTDGCFELYLDAASNSLLGEFNQGAARLNAACVVRRNPQIQDVYWDFDTLLDYLDAIGDNNPNRNRILYGLRAAQNLIVYKDPEWYSKTKKILTGLFELPGCENIQVTAVGHAHLDLAWLWPIRETKRKARRTFANFVDLARKYPDFHFVVSQPQQLVWVREQDPDLYHELKQLEKDGIMEIIGGGWVESDTNLPGEESLARQMLYGQKFWQEEFGHYVKTCWLPDAFGYSAGFPQILKLSGQDSFMTIKISWSNRTVFPYNSFYWEGVDGTRILVHMPPEGNYNSLAGPKALLNAKNGIKQSDPKDRLMMVYGVGDGGGGPSETTLERNRRTSNVPYLPKVKMGSAQAYFDQLREEDLPIYCGEMYLEMHRGTYTSQSNSKNNSREFEEKMLSLEKFLSVSGNYGNKEAVDALWKEALLYQFHDVIPGSSIRRVYEESNAMYHQMLERLEKMAQEVGLSFQPGARLLNPTEETVFTIQPAGDSFLLYEGREKEIPPRIFNNPRTGFDISHIETDFYSLDIALDGSFENICLSGSGKKIAGSANRLRVFMDTGDAWDFEDDYREQPERYMSLKKTDTKDYGDLVVLEQTYQFKESELHQTVLFYRHDPCIYVTHHVNWRNTGYMLRSETIPQTWAPIVYSDIQYGYLGRPTSDETAHEAAQFEMCCQKWMDLSQKSCGLAVLNNAKNGFMAKRGILSINLLRSTDYPCTHSDQEPCSYSYAFYPHEGGFDPLDMETKARCFSSRYLYGENCELAPSFDNPQIQITAFKPAYDGEGFVLRAFECTGQETMTSLRLPRGFEVVSEVNLLEDPVGSVERDLCFKPFQIRSFRLRKTSHSS